MKHLLRYLLPPLLLCSASLALAEEPYIGQVINFQGILGTEGSVVTQRNLGRASKFILGQDGQIYVGRNPAAGLQFFFRVNPDDINEPPQVNHYDLSGGVDSLGAMGNIAFTQNSEGRLFGFSAPVRLYTAAASNAQQINCPYRSSSQAITYATLYELNLATLQPEALALKTADGSPLPNLCPLGEMAVDADDNLWFFSQIASTHADADGDKKGQLLYRLTPPQGSETQWTLTEIRDVTEELGVSTSAATTAATHMPTRLFFSQDGSRLYALSAKGDADKANGYLYHLPVSADGAIGAPVVMLHAPNKNNIQQGPGVLFDRYPPLIEVGDYLYGAFYAGTENTAADLHSGQVWRIHKDAVHDADASALEIIYTSQSEDGTGFVRGPLALAADGRIYGTASGGTYGMGRVYRLTPSDSSDVADVSFEPAVYEFNGTDNGQTPMGFFASADGEKLYTITGPLDENQALHSGYLVVLEVDQLTPLEYYHPVQLDQFFITPERVAPDEPFTLTYAARHTDHCRIYEGLLQQRVIEELDSDASKAVNGTLELTRSQSGSHYFTLGCRHANSEYLLWNSGRAVMVTVESSSQNGGSSGGSGSDGSKSGSSLGLMLLLPFLWVLLLRRRQDSGRQSLD